jgi:hypothetical protein
MSSSQRRYEILLPLRFNDGQAVPDDLIAETLLDMRKCLFPAAGHHLFTWLVDGEWVAQRRFKVYTIEGES